MLKDKLYETVEHLLGKSVDEMGAEEAKAFAEGAAALLEGSAWLPRTHPGPEPPVLSHDARHALAELLDENLGAYPLWSMSVREELRRLAGDIA